MRNRRKETGNTILHRIMSLLMFFMFLPCLSTRVLLPWSSPCVCCWYWLQSALATASSTANVKPKQTANHMSMALTYDTWGITSLLYTDSVKTVSDVSTRRPMARGASCLSQNASHESATSSMLGKNTCATKYPMSLSSRNFTDKQGNAPAV